jgi:hypothetical protein
MGVTVSMVDSVCAIHKDKESNSKNSGGELMFTHKHKAFGDVIFSGEIAQGTRTLCSLPCQPVQLLVMDVLPWKLNCPL